MNKVKSILKWCCSLVLIIEINVASCTLLLLKVDIWGVDSVHQVQVLKHVVESINWSFEDKVPLNGEIDVMLGATGCWVDEGGSECLKLSDDIS